MMRMETLMVRKECWFYVNGLVDDEEGVYNHHNGKEETVPTIRHKNDLDHGWRRLVPAQWIGGIRKCFFGDVVWTKKLDNPLEVPMPDGRLVRQY